MTEINDSPTNSRLKRLIFRSVHRGCKETDLVFGQFAAEALPSLQGQELDTYERLLDEDDADIWQWLIGKQSCAPEYTNLINTLKTYGVPK